MSKDDVGNLVPDNSRDLGLVVCGLDRSAVDVDRATGKGKGVNFLLIDNFKGEREFVLVGRFCDEPLSEGCDIGVGVAASYQVELLLRLLGYLLSQLDVLCGTERVEAGLQPRSLRKYRHAQNNQSNQNQTSLHGSPPSSRTEILDDSGDFSYVDVSGLMN